MAGGLESGVSMWVFLDRDGVVLPSGERPQLRRFEAALDAGWPDLLVLCGVPLHFVDGHGVWVVSIGQGSAGPDPVGVVRQVPDASGKGSGAEVLFTVGSAPREFLAEDGALYLFYSSVPGPVDEVVDTARAGSVWRPPLPGLVDNVPVREAVSAFAADPGPGAVLEVSRQLLGGQLLLDVTGSEPENPRITTADGPDGAPALLAFTRQEELSRFHEGIGDVAGDQVGSLALSGLGVCRLLMERSEIAWLYVDPAGPACALSRADVDFAGQGAPNAEVKDALAGSPSQQEIFSALVGSGALFLGEREEGGRKAPATITEPGGNEGEDGRVLLAVFTSAVEVAAFDPSLAVRQFRAGWVVNFTFRQRLGGMVVNPGGPSAVVPSFQIWHILANPVLEG